MHSIQWELQTPFIQGPVSINETLFFSTRLSSLESFQLLAGKVFSEFIKNCSTSCFVSLCSEVISTVLHNRLKYIKFN